MPKLQIDGVEIATIDHPHVENLLALAGKLRGRAAGPFDMTFNGDGSVDTAIRLVFERKSIIDEITRRSAKGQVP